MGDVEPRQVPALRARLAASGDLGDFTAPVSPRFDESVERAVVHFQRRHGLEPDGVVGRATRAALAVPVEARIRQVDATLARRRTFAGDLDERFVLVNVPGNQLDLVVDGRRELSMKVIVGSKKDPTPELDAMIESVELNPYWNVPESITREELARKELERPGHLESLGIRAFTDVGADRELALSSIDWAAVAAGASDVFLRQDPGPKNSVGRFKIKLPNDEDVFLHDTPEKDLFDLAGRALSHGCVRLENALLLAAHLLEGDPEWSEEALAAALASGERREIKLPRPTPVHLVYWTAWVDANGDLQLRDDVYGWDASGSSLRAHALPAKAEMRAPASR